MELELILILALNELMRDLQVALSCILCKGRSVTAQPQEQDFAWCDQSSLLVIPFPNISENNKPIQPVRTERVRDFRLLMGVWGKALVCTP